MTKAYRRGISEAESNARALERRGLPFAEQNRTSVGMAYDYRRRQPDTLRDAVKMARRAYADEVPAKLHDSGLSDDGSPRWTATATSIIFGNAQVTDAGPRPKCDPSCRFHPSNVFGDLSDGGQNHESHCPAYLGNRPILSYYLFPFRATLDRMTRADEPSRKRAAIVSHVTIGSQGPQEAAIAEGVPHWCAKLVAFDALRSFLGQLSDMRVDTRQETTAA